MNSKEFEKEQFETTSLNSLNSLFSDNRDTGNGWYIKVHKFTSGDVETVALKLDSDQSIRKGGGAKRTNSDKDEMLKPVLAKSQQRSRRTIRHKAMMLNADRMLTLTYRDNVTCLKTAWKDFKAFSRKMKSDYDDKWQYICVPEFQKRGAVHFHLAIHGRFDVDRVRKIWRSVIGDGNIDITSPRQFGKSSWNPRRISAYLSKYLTKTDSVDFNQRRFSSSNIPNPPSVSGWMAFHMHLTIDVFLTRLIKQITDKLPTNFFHRDDGMFPLVFVTT
jgi:hypothetical protein